MTIRELFDQPGVHLSCEVFPPKVFDKVEEAKAAAFAQGVNRGIDPFMTLSFMALPVIPTLRITTRGVFDVNTQRYI